MAKAYKAGSSSASGSSGVPSVTVRDVKGNPADYMVYLYLSSSVGWINFSNTKLTRSSATTWTITTGAQTQGESAILYWALVKKANPTVGKPIVRMGSATTKNSKLKPPLCQDCRVLGNTTGNCYTRYDAFDLSGSPTNRVVRWITMKESSFLAGIKLL